MPYLTELNRRSSTAGLKHLTRQDHELCPCENKHTLPLTSSDAAIVPSDLGV